MVRDKVRRKERETKVKRENNEREFQRDSLPVKQEPQWNLADSEALEGEDGAGLWEGLVPLKSLPLA